MTTRAGIIRDDRVLAYTRVLSLVIIPFLLAAFVVLYIFPGDTGRLFAWPIKSTMSAMTLGSAYLGGAYFFGRVLWERHWHVVKTGFVAVAVFAGLLAVATVVHWDKFNHGHVPFWVWTALYFTAPVLVMIAWLVNRRFAAIAEVGEERIGRPARRVIGLVGVLALVQGVVMFLQPAWTIAVWPWPLTPLTCRVLGAIFCLGSAGLVVLVDSRWTTIRLMLQVDMLMIGLMLIASVRARTEFDAHRPLTWLLLAGFVFVLTGSALAWYRMEVRRRPQARTVVREELPR